METYVAVAYARKDGLYRKTSHYAKDPKSFKHENPKTYKLDRGNWERYNISIDGILQIWGSSDIERSLRYYEKVHDLKPNSVVLQKVVSYYTP